MNRLFADIETLPDQVLAFSAGFKQTINHDAIFKERCIICIGYKWEGDKKARVLRFDKNQCDKKMLQEFIAIANQADEIVGHYGDHFDWPWIRTRAVFHKLPPFPVWKTVDTKKISSKYFYFNSNKLDYISNFLGHGKKLKTDFDLWKRIALKNDKKAIDYMCKYCAIDVDRLEKVYHDIIAFCPHKTNQGVLAGGEQWMSPFTGSTHVKKTATLCSAAGTIKHQMKCLDTGRYYSISQKAYAAYREWRDELKGKKQ